jgi:hypothetical protein
MDGGAEDGIVLTSESQTEALKECLELLYKELMCGICLSVVNQPHILPCNHFFCQKCLVSCLCSLLLSPCSCLVPPSLPPSLRNLFFLS